MNPIYRIRKAIFLFYIPHGSMCSECDKIEVITKAIFSPALCGYHYWKEISGKNSAYKPSLTDFFNDWKKDWTQPPQAYIDGEMLLTP